MLSVVLVGTGNVAHHLFSAFRYSKSVNVLQVIGRNFNALKPYSNEVEVTTDFDKISEADVYLLAVSDNAIQSLSKKLENKPGLITHTSGATEMGAITNSNRGVFYPLQTFSKERRIEFKDIPVCIEAENEEGLNILKKLGESISGNVVEISSEQRKKLHLAAVFVNNFANHLYHIGEDICEKEGMSFNILKPLIQETAQKIMDLSPFDAQTGPARRGDTKTIEAHLKLLENEKQTELYTKISQAILETYEKEL
nr:Rossmann-like and DUF2520 domain-containing protein [Allomuricauda sp.]